MQSLRLALGCLTIVPVGPRATPPDAAFGRSWIWFPLIGLLIGVMLVGAYRLLAPVMPALVTTVLVLGIWVLLTGALHLDGLADVCDGLYGGHTPTERLRIMKDPHLGTMAAVGVAMHLLLKFAVLHSLSSSAIVPALLLIPCLGRYAMVIPGTTLPYARTEDGAAASFVRHATVSSLLIATLAALALSWAIAGRIGLGLCGVVGGVALMARAVFSRALGGITGDALGAVGEIAESVALVCVVAWC
ncbi:MAG: adenosylcobinamide-GDP ribazoletransferase [Candidatus Omnitrophica bacterium]|nr:adenosylcobinamide-GDP ribazoletransferase [Candidatus Omnitrophota bacterium]